MKHEDVAYSKLEIKLAALPEERIYAIESVYSGRNRDEGAIKRLGGGEVDKAG